jgi:hypothetical protein
MLLINHKCGLRYYEHLFTENFYGEASHISQKEIWGIEDWHLAVQHEELAKFLEQYDEREFSKMMITRNPYERLVSFYANTFWDHAKKPTYTDPAKAGQNGRGYSVVYRKLFGKDYDTALEIMESGRFQQGFDMFLDCVFIHPTPGALKHAIANQGYGDAHLSQQSMIYKVNHLTDIQFIDLHAGPPKGDQTQEVMDFLELEEMVSKPVNRSSASVRRKVKESQEYYNPDTSPVINEFYRQDFEDFGYEMFEFGA